MKKNNWNWIILSLISLSITSLLSCANMGVSSEVSSEDFDSGLTKYNENPNYGVWGQRHYKKTTKSQLEEESDLDSKAGSLWVMDGKQSYYFTQNKNRKEGDFLNVRIEGAALKQVETKVSIIKNLLQELEQQEKDELFQKTTPSDKQTSVDLRAPASEAKKAPEKEEKSEISDLGPIQARIVERLNDGNYRIKGQQPFMIGKREYKVIVAGVLRPEDFNDEGINSSKIIDPQFDVVSIRKKEVSKQ